MCIRDVKLWIIKISLKICTFSHEEIFSEFVYIKVLAIESDESLHVSTFFSSPHHFFSRFSCSLCRRNGEIKVSEQGKPFMYRG